MLINLWLAWMILKGNATLVLKKYAKWLVGLLVLEIIAGIILNRYALPAFSQPLHLLLACIIYAIQFVIILRVMKRPGEAATSS
jgi:cytochrome c oxidase assembly protein subunit 15